MSRGLISMLTITILILLQVNLSLSKELVHAPLPKGRKIRQIGSPSSRYICGIAPHRFASDIRKSITT